MDTTTSAPASTSTTSGGNAEWNAGDNSETTLSMSGGPQQIREELPFLVTHWLANYSLERDDDSGGGSSSNNNNSNSSSSNNKSKGTNDNEEAKHRERAAIAKIRKATSELASAFASIGAYGTTFRSSLESPSSFLHQPVLHNRTFGDLNRMHAGRLAPSHLEHLAQSVAFNSATADATARAEAHTDFLLRANSPGEPTTTTTTTTTPGSSSSKTGNAAAATTMQGRSLNEAINVDMDSGDAEKSRREQSMGGWGHRGQSILQRPALIASSQQRDRYAASDSNPVDNNNNNNNNEKEKESNNTLVRAEREEDETPTIDIRATHWEVAHQTAETVRQFLTVREQLRSVDNEIRSLEASSSLHQDTVNKVKQRLDEIGKDTTMTGVEKLEAIGRCKNSQQTSDRVIIQLVRKLSDLKSRQKGLRLEVGRLESRARSLEQRRQNMLHNFRDPFASWKGSLSKGSRVGGCFALQTIVGRQQGLSRGRLSMFPKRSNLLRGPNPAHFLECRKNLLTTRLSHAVTINAHMNCPVYCLRFDRTGRYFVTGADDFLLKVFYIGAAQSCRRRNGANKNRRLRCNYGANFRGAVLVCTLRGHAGVINDIDVSMDNCLLATASVDGDVRVWGLKNGCPVAILRGHKGGANMVSWSTLTPYRLVSTGSDGFARVWDIREACLKRYGNVVNLRGEYNLRLTADEKKVLKVQNERRKKGHQGAEERVVPDLLPPLPSRNESSAPTATSNAMVSSQRPDASAPSIPRPPDAARAAAPSDPSSSLELANNDNNRNNNNNDNDNGIIVPPLPAAVPPLGQGADGGNPNAGGGRDANAVNGAAPGDFVANDLVDEGVKLLSKYQHGTIQEEHGPGTRSRRSAVNVICVSRCPLGNQFVTGSDDAIIRVWEDCDDSSIAIVDARLGSTNLEKILPNARDSLLGGDKEPLLKLMGHVSTVTDLAYSHAGDRILSASQKDGVVRVWNIGVPTVKEKCGKMEFKNKRVTQIVINLVNPFSTKSSQPKRRRPGNAARNAGSKVCCDVAVWTHDDSSIVTSQCVPVKENSSDIQPGSHFICMWDSKSGRCLISISGAHTSQCQVLIPHPTDASILCTASTDGFVKLWDWNKGKCIFSHRNKVEFGPTDPNSPNKIGGYLDGSFSPDGTSLVLTDDDGFITVLDSISDDDDPPNSGKALVWMREQYFANDYYDLAYDRNGYCIEKGSEKPPHLAPKGARCTHNGAPYSEDVNESFQRLSGPSPLPENLCSWRREQMRTKRFSDKYTIQSSGREPTVRVSVREFDPLSTIIIRGVDHRGGDVVGTSKSRIGAASAFGSSGHPGGPRNQSSAPTRNLSANYRYLDYDDLIRREGNPEEDEPDSDDEEFQPVAARTQTTGNSNNDEVESEDDDIDDFDMYVEGTNRRRSGQRNESSSRTAPAVERRVRAERRAQRHDTDFMEIDSDDEMIAQFVSANRTPTGPYVRDYTINGHYWRLKSQADAARVRRKWLHREESDSSYFGRNAYTPQMGDSIVYVPRAHFETIKQCPSLSPPWQSWPTSAVWPVVRCFVRGIRFRFPYEDYFRTKQHAKCSSVVAILTLEVTGIPEISDDREFPWPKPSFIEPTRPFIFELSVFESSSCEYIIPETLYTSRITALENHIRSRNNCAVGLEVDLYYEQEHEDSDLQAWPATVEGILPDESHSDVHLRGSGFGVVQVGDGTEENKDFVSPWELNTEGVNLTRPCMSEDERKCVLQELNRLLRKEEIANHLSMPVDQERYCDYAMMVEIPMDLMLVKNRLAANFYGSKLGVASDLRVIRDNCIKYNTDQNMMSDIASNMCKDFEEKTLTTDERSQMISEEEFDKIHREQSEGRQVSSLRIRLSARTVQEATQGAGSSGGRYTLRDRTTTQGQSLLESLPAPANGSVQAQRSRNRSEVDTMNAPRNRPRIDETEVLGQMARLRSGRRGALSVDTSSNNSNIGRRTRIRRNESNFASVDSPRTLRGGSIRENSGIGDRSSRRTRNSDDQNIRNPARAPSYDEDSNNSIDHDDEEIDTNRSEPGNNRRSLRSTVSHSSEIQRGAFNDEENPASVPPMRDSTRAGRRTTRSNNSSASARSRYLEEQNSEESDAEDDVFEEQKEEASESDPEQQRKDSDAESRYSENGDESAASSSDDNLSVDKSPPAKRGRASTRTTRNTAPARARAPARAQAPAPAPTEPSSERRSSRKAVQQRKKYEEIDSDEDEYVSEEDGSDDDDDDADVSMARSSRRRGRPTSARRYTVPDSDDDDEESEEEEPPPPKPKRAAGKRKGSASSRRSSKAKKARIGTSSTNSTTDLPEISEWPEIGVGNITRVSTEILNKVSENDRDGLFSKPVIEAYPDIADAYLSIIETPMDLRTIEEERVNIYSSIKMLQKDLIVMFRNCWLYNGQDSEFGAIAAAQIVSLNQMFLEACEDLDIMIPRRWEP